MYRRIAHELGRDDIEFLWYGTAQATGKLKGVNTFILLDHYLEECIAENRGNKRDEYRRFVDEVEILNSYARRRIEKHLW